MITHQLYVNASRLRLQTLLLCGVALLAAPSAANAQMTERICCASSTGDAGGPAVSDDGNVIAFSSTASDIVVPDTNGNTHDVFVFDRTTSQFALASVASDGTQANHYSALLAMSGNGRFLVFYTLGNNLAANDLNGTWDVYLRDLQNNTTELISVATSGNSGNNESAADDLSADGRFVAFFSRANDLATGDTNGPGVMDAYIRDRLTGTTELVSVTPTGVSGNSHSYHAFTSDDGRFVAFDSDASDIVPGDTNNATDTFVRDRLTNTTVRVSVANDGSEANAGALSHAFSSDGRYVAFVSPSSNLVAGDTNGVEDVFVRDLLTGTTTRVSVSSSGVQADGPAEYYSLGMSPDGALVAFKSHATNLAPGDTNGAGDVFVHNMQTGETERISVAADGTQANDQSFSGGSQIISADHRFVAFWSWASNLTAGDVNYRHDVFLRDRGPQIVYDFIGFNSPVENLPLTNAAKAGSAVPVKWQLTDGDGNFVSDLSVVESLQYAATACDAQDFDLAVPIEAYASGGSGLQYDAATNEFVYPWKTAKSQKGTCAVFGLTLTDGQQHFARFLLK